MEPATTNRIVTYGRKLQPTKARITVLTVAEASAEDFSDVASYIKANILNFIHNVAIIKSKRKYTIFHN